MESIGRGQYKAVMSEVRYITLPKYQINTYGKGSAGANIPKYMQQIAEVTANIIKTYPIKQNVFGNHLTMDDNYGT